jgi:hypothetical protein
MTRPVFPARVKVVALWWSGCMGEESKGLKV